MRHRWRARLLLGLTAGVALLLIGLVAVVLLFLGGPGDDPAPAAEVVPFEGTGVLTPCPGPPALSYRKAVGAGTYRIYAGTRDTLTVPAGMTIIYEGTTYTSNPNPYNYIIRDVATGSMLSFDPHQGTENQRHVQVDAALTWEARRAARQAVHHRFDALIASLDVTPPSDRIHEPWVEDCCWWNATFGQPLGADSQSCHARVNGNPRMSSLPRPWAPSIA